MIFNPIQMGPDFTSWYMSDIEIRVRSMVDELMFEYGHHNEIPIDIVNQRIHDYGFIYEDLPQSCKNMIDELKIC